MRILACIVMPLFMFVAVVLLVLSVSPEYALAAGKTYYVSLTGNDRNDGLSESRAWRTISHACSKAEAGDTVIIKSGNYGDENAVIANSGTADAPITIKAEEPGKVILKGDGDGNGIRIEGKHHIIIEGIKFANYTSGIAIGDPASYITVKKCVFVENNSAGIIVWGHSGDISITHHFEFAYNEFYDYTDKQDYAVSLNYGMYAWVHNNYFFGVHHQALSFKRKWWHGLAENNIFEGFRFTALYLGQNLNKGSEDNRSRYLIAQGNVFRPAKNFRAKTCIWVANVEHAVVRYNYMEGLESVDGGWGQGVALGDHESGYEPANPTHIRIYGNVMRRISGTTTNPGIRVIHDCEDVRVFHNTFAYCAYGLGFEVEKKVHFINNIFYKYQRGMTREGNGRNCIFEHNCIYPNWRGKGATDFFEDPRLAGPFDHMTLKDENPHFEPDFSRAYACRLRSGSPCIDAGKFLTHTIDAGNGKKIKVKDALYFTDGFGVAEGDIIKVGGSSPVKIVKMDYANNTITVDKPVKWKKGSSVSLCYSGRAPDVGAHERGIKWGIFGKRIEWKESFPCVELTEELKKSQPDFYTEFEGLAKYRTQKALVVFVYWAQLKEGTQDKKEKAKVGKSEKMEGMLRDKSLREMSDKFIWVRVNGRELSKEKQKAIAERHRIAKTPCILLVDIHGKVWRSITTPKRPKSFIRTLKRFLKFNDRLARSLKK